MSDLGTMTDWAQLKELLAQQEAGRQVGRIDKDKLLAHLRSRVKGQDPILGDVANLLHLQMSKVKTDRPIANILFLGPTGTGKTELAKAIAEHLYDDEKNMLRFDCSEFTDSTAKTRLIGTPKGYVGSDAGGQLTRPVLAQRRRVILFDEIEKAYSSVFDLFLQLMGEARLTEQGSGRTADYSQCIVILTSNAHAEQIAEIQQQSNDYYEMVNAVKSYLADSGVFRPELLGRIDRVYVFKPLEGMVIAEIALLKIGKLGREYGLSVQFVEPTLILKALASNEKVSRFGVRELDRIVFDMYASRFAEARAGGAKDVRVSVGADGEPEVTSLPEKANA